MPTHLLAGRKIGKLQKSTALQLWHHHSQDIRKHTWVWHISILGTFSEQHGNQNKRTSRVKRGISDSLSRGNHVGKNPEHESKNNATSSSTPGVNLFETMMAGTLWWAALKLQHKTSVSYVFWTRWSWPWFISGNCHSAAESTQMFCESKSQCSLSNQIEIDPRKQVHSDWFVDSKYRFNTSPSCSRLRNTFWCVDITARILRLLPQFMKKPVLLLVSCGAFAHK